jgi:hypothetical protein
MRINQKPSTVINYKYIKKKFSLKFRTKRTSSSLLNIFSCIISVIRISTPRVYNPCHIKIKNTIISSNLRHRYFIVNDCCRILFLRIIKLDCGKRRLSIGIRLSIEASCFCSTSIYYLHNSWEKLRLCFIAIGGCLGTIWQVLILGS